MLREMKVPCWEIECDLCGRGDNVEYDGCFHHPSRAEAIGSGLDHDFVVDQADGFAVCDDCVCGRLAATNDMDDGTILAAAREAKLADESTPERGRDEGAPDA